ncbi:hypothetical protein GM415_10655 [Pseudodesulfovibrio cashew]|uniref:Uncharacterized protein n=1 Tax=Pseudodesulfovibrio cashew TaxID=2678688 RepID=A0A6I6JCM7_9BACT|nr:hypothetical protein [Pseudodesulfovibrio cashew]QGY40565.1 hypothetical protein GM415_10655 [Pseudodesulfovibrio cashew]
MLIRLASLALLFGVVGLVWTGSVYADDTIYCPNDPVQLKKQCAEKQAFIKKAQALVDKWERNYQHRGAYSLMRYGHASKAQYNKWTKPSSVTVKGVPMKVYGTYRSSNGDVYVYVADQKHKQVLNQYGKGNTFKSAKSNSNRIMSNNLQTKLNKYRHALSQAYAYRAQCCGARWTNDGPGSTPNRGNSGSSGGIDLLGVPMGN